MGIKTFYILNTGGTLFTGPAAYRKLLTDKVLIETGNKTRRVPIKIYDPIFKSWRKNITPLFKTLTDIVYAEGALKVIKKRRGKSDATYRETLRWIDGHVTRLKSPRTGKRID